MPHRVPQCGTLTGMLVLIIGFSDHQNVPAIGCNGCPPPQQSSAVPQSQQIEVDTISLELPVVMLVISPIPNRQMLWVDA